MRDAISCTDSPVAAVDARFLIWPVIGMVWPFSAYAGLTDVTLSASGSDGDWLPDWAVAVPLSSGSAAQNPATAVTNNARAARLSCLAACERAMAHMVLRLASASGRPVLSTRQPDHGRA